MPNIWNADCGFNPNQKDKFEDLTVEVINNPEGVDLTGHKNMHISLASESSDVSIEDFECMVPGMEYTIVAANAAQKQLEVKLPANTTLYNGTITKAAGMTLVYRFFTDGISIYCQRGVYA